MENDFLTRPDGSVVYALSLRDVACMVSVSYKTVWRDSKTGELKTFKIGRLVRVTVTAFREYLQQKRGGSAT